MKSQRSVDTQSKTSSHSQRLIDTKASDVVTKYVQDNILTKLFDKSVVNVDKQSQLAGIDVYTAKYSVKTNVSDNVLATMTEREIVIDIKAQINYINRPTSTFAFEVESGRVGGERVDGWLYNVDVDDVKMYYMLVWLRHCTCDDKKQLKNVGMIKEVEWGIIGRTVLQNYINENIGWDNIEKYRKQIREQNCRRIEFYPEKECIHKIGSLVYSSFLAEQPIVLVLPKKKLLELCEWKGVTNT